MTANNINIQDFISILLKLKESGVKLMNLDMLPDEDNSRMNKLVIHPVVNLKPPLKTDNNLPLLDPNIDKDDDIYTLFINAI